MKQRSAIWKNGIYRVVLILLLLSLPLTGCRETEPTGRETTSGNEETGVMDGFLVSNGDEVPRLTCGYKSDKTEFDIDDVTLTFYYGGDFYDSIELEQEKCYNYPTFDLCFSNDQERIVVKHVEENFVSEKYRTTWVNENQDQKIIYNHSEVLTVPQCLFTLESGIIYFSLYGDNVRTLNEGYRHMECGCAFQYRKVENNKVIISKLNY